MDNILI